MDSIPWWAQWLAGGGLLALGAFATKLYPILLAFLTGKREADRSDRQALDERQAHFDNVQQTRIDSLVKQLDEVNVKLVAEAKTAAAAEARTQALRELIGDKIDTVQETVNGHSKDMQAKLDAATIQIQRLEEAQAKAIQDAVKAALDARRVSEEGK